MPKLTQRTFQYRHQKMTALMDSLMVDALITLGYSQKEARDVMVALDPSFVDTNARVKEALRLLSSQR